MEFKCPTCKKVIPSASTGSDGKKKLNGKFFPFCSERCKLLDMGAWFEGKYSIPVSDEDVDEVETGDDESSG